MRAAAVLSVLMVAVGGVGGGACGDNAVVTHETPYFCADGQRQVGGIDLDGRTGTLEDPILDAYQLAVDDRCVYSVYAHDPGVTVTPETIEAALARAQQLGLPFVTYAELAAGGAPRPALALAFDDDAVDHWMTLRPLLAQYGAHATFFVTRFYELPQAQRDELHQLAADGHAIEAHSHDHVDARDYIAANGLDAYLADQAEPSIDALAADGFPRPVAYAYPYGGHTEELDEAMLALVQITRGISTVPGGRLPTDADAGTGSGSE